MLDLRNRVPGYKRGVDMLAFEHWLEAAISQKVEASVQSLILWTAGFRDGVVGASCRFRLQPYEAGYAAGSSWQPSSKEEAERAGQRVKAATVHMTISALRQKRES